MDGEPLSGEVLAKEPCSKLPGDESSVRWQLPRGPLEQNQPQKESQWLDLRGIKDAFIWEEGYCRPNWNLIRETIEQKVETANRAAAWDEAVLQWADQLRGDLGGQCAVRCSRQFVLVSALEERRSIDLLRFAEGTLERIYGWLKDAAWQWQYGRHVILLFEDDEDYYQYVAYFYGEGVHPASGGCLIHKGYVHIAMPDHGGRSIHRTIAHELVHNSVVHLSLPLWLNEGLAVSFERTGAWEQNHILHDDLLERHRAFWNRETIQEFWAGVSFKEPGDSNTLSYNLAEILTHLLFSERSEMQGFLKAARREDAAQSAALDVLGADLGQIAGIFLGPGDWRPNRKAIQGCWNAARLAENRGDANGEAGERNESKSSEAKEVQ